MPMLNRREADGVADPNPAGARCHDETQEAADSASPILQALTAGVWTLAGLGIIFAAQWARPLLVPIIFGFLVSYALDPVVTLLTTRGVSRGLAAWIVMAALITGVGGTAYIVRGQVNALIARLPGAAQQLRETLQRHGTQPTAMTRVQQAADELNQIKAPNSSAAAAEIPRKVQIEPKSFDFADYLWSTSRSVVGFLADVIVVLVLALYLLICGDLFRRRAIEIAGPTLTRKKITLQILNDISRQISSYLFLRTVISAIVAALTALALWLAGLEQAVVWGFAAGVLNVVPYIGSFAAAIAIGLAGFLQFHTWTMAALVAALTILVACLEGYAITPLLTSRTAEMNPVAVFVGLAFWGWLWGLPGLLLAIPLMMILRAIGEHVEPAHPLVALLKR